jgi:hypothetical protein
MPFSIGYWDAALKAARVEVLATCEAVWDDVAATGAISVGSRPLGRIGWAERQACDGCEAMPESHGTIVYGNKSV